MAGRGRIVVKVTVRFLFCFCVPFYQLKMKGWLSLGSFTMPQTFSAWESTYWLSAHSTGKNPSLASGNDTQSAQLTHKWPCAVSKWHNHRMLNQ